jgi:antitoxin (DNA-binding transcriptional repressor) of toxin-antitoxin stability system
MLGSSTRLRPLLPIPITAATTNGQMTVSPDILVTVKERVLSASEFKTKCLACLGEIERFGEPITITRRGRPVAVLGPAKPGIQKSPRNSWARKGRIVGEILNQDTSVLWEVARSAAALL